MNSKLFYACINCIITMCVIFVCGDIYSTDKEMGKLVPIQKSVMERLTTFVFVEKEKISHLIRYLKKFKKQHNEVIADTRRFVGNPMNKFLYIKSLTSDLVFVKALVGLKPDFNATYPSQEDLTAVANSVARLQETYLLNVSQLAAGQLKGYHSTPMSISDCYELGRVLIEDLNYKAARDWFLHAYSMVDTAIRQRHPMLIAKIVEAICLAYIYLGDKKNTNKWVKKLEDLELDSDFTSKVRALIEQKREIEENVDYKKNINESEIENYHNITRNYGRLCRGEMKPPRELQCRLKCRYLMSNPFLKLAPLKMEQLYMNPDVYLFYDVMSDAEIEKNKSSGYPGLVRAHIHGNMSGTVSKDRISFYSWLSSEDVPVVDKVYSRIADMTGLSTASAENLQLALYPPGGFYRAHFDALQEKKGELFLTSGYRIATVMFYLAEVEEGGATVFINLGLTVFPIKGAALFWYNTHSSGEIHRNTLHSACPVILGYKWAANIWLHANGQEFSHPCEIGGDKTNETLLPPLWKLAGSNSDE